MGRDSTYINIYYNKNHVAKELLIDYYNEIIEYKWNRTNKRWVKTENDSVDC